MDKKEREHEKPAGGAAGRPVGRVDVEAAKGGREPVPSNLRAGRSATRRLLQGRPCHGSTAPRKV
jgi:hypothetical protein